MSGAWQCQKGHSLLVPSGPQEGHKHLFALMLDPVVVDGYGSKPIVLLACVTSIREGIPHEDGCVLKPGDHAFISHDSYVDYRFTRLESVKDIDARVESGVFLPKEPCSPELIKRIIVGALSSRRIRREYKQLLEKVLFG